MGDMLGDLNAISRHSLLMNLDRGQVERITWLCTTGPTDEVTDWDDASHTPCGGFCSSPLVVPLYLTVQRDPSVLKICLHFFS
jgi:hypothetical protein